MLLDMFHDCIIKSYGRLSFPGCILIPRTEVSILEIFAGTIISELNTTVTRPCGLIDFIFAVNFKCYLILIFVMVVVFLTIKV